MSRHPLEVPVERLRHVCDPTQFNFRTTEEVEPLAEAIIGQERAVRAMEFGLRVRCPGYNVYVSGPTGTGRSTYARSAVEAVAADGAVPDDWCYVNNFDDPVQPLALRLPAGQGRKFAQDVDELVDDLKAEIPKIMASKEFDERKAAVRRKYQEESSARLGELDAAVKASGFALQHTTAGFLTVPLKEGKPMDQEDLAALTDEERADLERRSEAVQEKVVEALRSLKSLEKEFKAELTDLERRAVSGAISPFFSRLEAKYEAVPRVGEYLEAFLKDVLDRLDEFKPREEGEGQVVMALAAMAQRAGEPSFRRYKVNLLVNNAEAKGAPVVIETNPTYYNLFGSIEYQGQLGTLATDFTLVKPGAIHRANGGYLILQAHDLLANPLSWEALKRALKNKEVRIENIGEQYRLVPTTTLRPEPVPLDVKVVLIGSSLVYQLLYNYDEDFRKFFKVKADFDVEMDRTPKHIHKYASFIGSVCRREELRHMDPSAVARIVEYSSRLVGDQDKLSTRFNEVVELVYESCAWAEAEGAAHVSASHVEKAIDEKIYRSNLIEEKFQEMLTAGKIMVDTEGRTVGQVNGLAVLGLGDYLFGKPTRITAKTFQGEDGVINIERESRLSGRLHNKGVLILGGFLGDRYGQDKPLTLSASLAFEQSYEEVDGDSASSTELYALLSSLSGLPIRQDLAVTGSVNQHGQVQPIGGVNQKIEGFFDLCAARGLTGSQGVLIPHQNVRDLMLKEEVIEAARAGLFHIYAVRTIDEGIEILTGIPAGERQADGSYPEDTVHGRVDRRLRRWAEEMARRARASGHGGCGEC